MNIKLYDAEIEYLRGTGTQYIDTGYTPVIGDSIYCEFMLDVAASRTFQCLYSAGTGNYQLISLLGDTHNNNTGAYIKHFATGNAPEISFNPSVNTWYTLTVTSAGVSTIGNFTITSSPAAEIDGNEKNLWLWKRRNNTSPFNGRIRRFYIMNNGVMKLDLIPVRAGNVGYMYDKVSSQLFGNSGTGDFVLGPDVAPAAYANEIAFLESTGSQYIDTGVNADSNLGFDITYAFTDFSEPNYVRFGAIKQTGTSTYARHHTSVQPGWLENGYMFGDYIMAIHLNTDKHNLILDSTNQKFVYDGTETSFTSTDFDCNLNYFLFGRNEYLNNISTINFAKIKIYQCRLYSSGVLVRDFIPVEYNNIGYMYDKVSGKFFANQGTGKFVLGHRAPRFDGKACARSYTRRQLMAENYVGKAPNGYKWLEYIENTSSAYINTGLIGKANLKIEADWLFKVSEVVGIMGASYHHNPRYALLYRANSTSASYFYYGDSNSAVSALTLNKKWHIVMDKGSLYYDDVLKKTFTATGDSTYNFMLFRVADHNSYIKGQLFGCKIWDDETLVRDYRPIKRLSDNKYGLWDKVEGKFYTSASSSNFTGE